MPRLLSFLPCQKAMIDQDNLASAVGIIQGIKANLIKVAGVIPQDIAIPMRWGVVICWKQDESDDSLEFEQLFQIVMPDGSIRVSNISSFHLPEKTHNTAITINDFPVSASGIVKLQISWRKKGEEDWTQVAEYPLDVELNWIEDNVLQPVTP